MVIDRAVVLARATAEGEAEYRAFVTQLKQRWADIEPVPSQPWMSSGDPKDGLWTLGRFDLDTKTNTYRTYRVFRFVYVPLFFLGAYRVQEDSRGGLLSIGRHPLPMWAQAWNVLGVVGLVVLAYVLARGTMEAIR